ncbi:hypothetical protein M5K25_010751 [Dendrobium thyrsiflorum]|uniref:Chromo domain-containing protein n=1 Tax=Dendrobium thyrsiflorum TaxID=117978 RepID=A0ABD0V854_DENTH
MNPIGLQKKLDDLVNLVGSLTKTTKEKHVDSPHFRYVPHSADHASWKMPYSKYQPRPEPKPQQQPRLESPYRLPTFDGSSDPYYFREWVRQLEDYFESRDIPKPHQVSIAVSRLSGSARQFWMRLEDRKESRGEYPTWEDMRRELKLKYLPSTRDQPSDSRIRSPPVHQAFRDGTLKNPICESRSYSPSTHQSDSATSSPHHMTVTHFSSSFVETNRGHSVVETTHLLVISGLLPHPIEEKRIRKKRSPEPETECIHFVDVNDITDNEDFFEDETEVIKLGSLHDLNPALGEVEPLNFNALVNPKSNPIKDIPLDKVYLNDINLISKETDLTLSTMKLNSKDSDLIITSTGLTSHNSELILDNFDYDLDNLELGVTQENFLLDLHPDLSGPESIDLRIITKSDPIENINTLLEDINLTLNNSELNLEDEHPKFLLESILGVAPLDLHLKECVSPDLTYLNNPCTDLNESISPYLPAASLTVVPAFVLETLPHLLSPIPAGDSLCYPIIVMSHDPSSYHTPESYIFPATSSTFPIKDHLSPSWLTLLDYTTATGRLSMTLVETSYRNALVVKDVFIAPPTPIPLNMGTLCHPILSRAETPNPLQIKPCVTPPCENPKPTSTPKDISKIPIAEKVDIILSDDINFTKEGERRRYLIRWKGKPESKNTWSEREELQRIDPDA